MVPLLGTGAVAAQTLGPQGTHCTRQSQAAVLVQPLPLWEDLLSPEQNSPPEPNGPVKFSTEKAKPNWTTEQKATEGLRAMQESQLQQYFSVAAARKYAGSMPLAPELNVTWILPPIPRPKMMALEHFQFTSRLFHRPVWLSRKGLNFQLMIFLD